ncbi:MAG: cytochrome P460 family protein [Rhizobiaceae bacterium]|nr:cytochrome P460 family protein [Rhizobiaceae bacterium]
MRTIPKFMIAGCAMMFSGPAFATCTSEVAKDDLTDEQVVELYDCIRDSLREGYAKEGGQWTSDYPSWGETSSQPVAAGTHGNRFLITFVNETGHAEYVKFSDERGPMPAGSVLAKESFNLNKKNQVQKGPLFFMEKVAAGNADEYGNWVYSVVQPNGKPAKISQKFCHDCHGAFSDQDSMGYPDEDYRITSQ